MNQIDRKRFYTLMAVAYSVAADLKEGNERVQYYLHLAMEGYREFNFDHAHQVKVVELPMTAWKTLDWPSDMVDWVKVGFKDGNMIRFMTQDAYIPRTFDKDPNNVGKFLENKPPIIMKETEVSGYPVWVYDGQGVAKYYGNDTNNNGLGYFDADMSERMFYFKETVSMYSSVYLEYISDGLECGAMTVVNPYSFMTLKDWVKWQRKENDDRFGAGDKQRAKIQYEQTLFKYMTRIVHMDIDDVHEAIMSGFSLVVQM